MSTTTVARRRGAAAALLLTIGAVAGCDPTSPPPAAGGPGSTVTSGSTPAVSSTGSPAPAGPSGSDRPDHVIVVVLENKAARQIIGSTDAAYLNALLADSALFTQSRAVAHPSQPNYLALFSGSTQDVTSDRCPLFLGDRPNLGRQLLDAGLTFIGYAEGLPYPGFTGCARGQYAAKHAPWVHFANLPRSANQPASAFPLDYARLPTVAFLIPDLCGDMHDCSIATGDAWVRDHLGGYVRWATDHNSLLVLTFDEDDGNAENRIVTLVAGAGVRPGRYSQPLNHYGVLASIEAWYGLPRLGPAAADLIEGIRS